MTPTAAGGGRAAPRPEAPRAEPARRLVRRDQRHHGPGQARLLRVQKLPGLLAARARPAERRVLVVPRVAARAAVRPERSLMFSGRGILFKAGFDAFFDS